MFYGPRNTNLVAKWAFMCLISTVMVAGFMSLISTVLFADTRAPPTRKCCDAPKHPCCKEHDSVGAADLAKSPDRGGAVRCTHSYKLWDDVGSDGAVYSVTTADESDKEGWSAVRVHDEEGGLVADGAVRASDGLWRDGGGANATGVAQLVQEHLRVVSSNALGDVRAKSGGLFLSPAMNRTFAVSVDQPDASTYKVRRESQQDGDGSDVVFDETVVFGRDGELVRKTVHVHAGGRPIDVPDEPDDGRRLDVHAEQDVRCERVHVAWPLEATSIYKKNPSHLLDVVPAFVPAPASVRGFVTTPPAGITISNDKVELLVLYTGVRVFGKDAVLMLYAALTAPNKFSGSLGIVWGSSDILSVNFIERQLGSDDDPFTLFEADLFDLPKIRIFSIGILSLDMEPRITVDVSLGLRYNLDHATFGVGNTVSLSASLVVSTPCFVVLKFKLGIEVSVDILQHRLEFGLWSQTSGEILGTGPICAGIEYVRLPTTVYVRPVCEICTGWWCRRCRKCLRGLISRLTYIRSFGGTERQTLMSRCAGGALEIAPPAPPLPPPPISPPMCMGKCGHSTGENTLHMTFHTCTEPSLCQASDVVESSNTLQHAGCRDSCVCCRNARDPRE